MLLNEEPGKFIYSRWGISTVLAFMGDEDFLKRCENFCINLNLAQFNILRQKNTSGTAYIMATEERIMKALELHFYMELINYKKVPSYKITTEVEDYYSMGIYYNEAELEVKSKQLALDFWNNKIEKRNILSSPEIVDQHAFGFGNNYGLASKSKCPVEKLQSLGYQRVSNRQSLTA